MNSQPIDRLDEIAAEVGARVPSLILDLRDQIMEAITAATEESQDEAETTQKEKRAALSIPISVKWDLSEMSVSVEASVSVKTKAKATIELKDPNQPELIGDDGDEVEIPLDAKNGIGKIMDNLRAEGVTVTVNRRLDV
jgi:VIT1/CCC1 family predicted Fe2+/Mn2+ transporter